MPETEYSQRNVAEIATRLDNIERLVRFDISSNPNSRARVEEHLKARSGSSEVYLALENGPKTQVQLMTDCGMSQGNVSKICTHLSEVGLIGRAPNPKNQKQIVFFQSDLEQLLAVSKIARKLIGSPKTATP